MSFWQDAHCLLELMHNASRSLWEIYFGAPKFGEQLSFHQIHLFTQSNISTIWYALVGGTPKA